MATYRSRNAFTLIEVLIVVVIMAVLAATIIPQFSSSTEDAKESALKFNMHSLRSQIEMYRVHHLGNYPEIQTVDGEGSLPQLYSATDSSGAYSSVGAAADSTHPYGPYINTEIPANPFTDSNAVVAVATAGVKPTAIVSGGAGWQYDVTTGAIWPNNSEYYSTTTETTTGAN